MIRSTRGSVQPSNYGANVHSIGTVHSAEEFWAVYGHLKRANELPTNSDYQVFRNGISPVWEDAANAEGGKWIVRLKKGLSGRLWEHLLLAVMSGALDEGVCGVVLSIRHAEDILAVWNNNATNEEAKLQLREQIKKVLSLPPATMFEYKAHDISLKDNSSFRNTDKAKP